MVPCVLPELSQRFCRARAEVVPLAVRDWLPTVFQGESFAFYLDALDAALSRLHASSKLPVSLVGHSAGGWLARILLGSQPYQGCVYGRCDRVRSLVTLGTPHLSIEAYPFGRVEVRRPRAVLPAWVLCV